MLCVRKALRGRGIGAALVDAVRSGFRRRQVCIEAACFPQDNTSRAFLEDCGFEVTESLVWMQARCDL